MVEWGTNHRQELATDLGNDPGAWKQPRPLAALSQARTPAVRAGSNAIRLLDWRGDFDRDAFLLRPPRHRPVGSWKELCPVHRQWMRTDRIEDPAGQAAAFVK